VVAYAALRELIPVFPVYALLFTDAGLSTGQVSSLFIIWSATHVLLEVPSGAWADTVARAPDAAATATALPTMTRRMCINMTWLP